MKKLALAMVLVLLCSMFTSIALAQDKPTLVIWEGEFQKEGTLKEYIRAFNEKYPDINIEYDIKSADSYVSLLNTALQTGEGPDIFWTHGTKDATMATFVEQGYLYDMTGDIDLSDYESVHSIAPSVCYVNDKLYCTPAASIDTRVMYYNTEIFDAHGYQIPATLSDFEALCDQMLTDGLVPIALGANNEWGNLFILDPILAAVCPEWMSAASKGEKVHVNDGAVAKAYGKYIEWAKKGYFGTDYLAASEDAAFLAFATQKTAMLSTGTWNCATIEGNNPQLKFSVFKIPDDQGRQNMVATPNSGYSINAKTPHLKESILFAQLLASLEGQQIFINEFGNIPELPQLSSTKDVYVEMGKYTGESYQSWYDGVLARPTKDGSSLQSLWGECCVNLLAGIEDLEAWLNEVDAIIDYDAM